MEEKYAAFLDTAVRAVREAGKIQRENFGARHNVQHKGEANLVTEVDLTCEDAIKDIITKDWPAHAILAEETGTRGGDEHLWIVDPLDGTTNYAHSFPVFCASVGVEERGVIVAGAVYDPIRDELFTATRGAGAYLNGRAIRTTSRSELEDAMVATGFPYDRERRMKGALPLMGAMLEHVQAIRRAGSAALDMCYVAMGRFDGFWEVSLHAWDIAAGWLIVEEAGGKVTGLDGTSTTIYSEQILASNGPLHSKLVNILSSAPVNMQGN